MRIATTLNQTDARRIARHLGMTYLREENHTNFAEDELLYKRASSFLVEDAAGKPITQGLAHLHFEQLESMPEDLRRRLLAAGHVYIECDNLRQARMEGADGGVNSAFFIPESEVLGKGVGIGRYTVPEPDIEAIGHSDMGRRFSFYRLMPEAYAHEDGKLNAQLADSDLRLFVDLGAIESIALTQAEIPFKGR